jgi:hypothetical protein
VQRAQDIPDTFDITVVRFSPKALTSPPEPSPAAAIGYARLMAMPSGGEVVQVRPAQ